MQSSIPYDPSLVLGSVLNIVTVELINQISQAQAPADAAREELDALLASRKNLDATKSELINLGIDTSPLDNEISNLNSKVANIAMDYARRRIEVEEAIKTLRSRLQSVSHTAQVESPIDRSKAQPIPTLLTTESLKMDVQYFPLDANAQSSSSFANMISSFVSSSTSWMGSKPSAEMSQAAEAQVMQQTRNHSIAGTLVLSASCTHKNGTLLEPFALDPDKSIKAWNRLFPSDKIEAAEQREMAELARTANESDSEHKLSIVSGMSLGSSFIGMVHILNSFSTEVDQGAVAKTHVTLLTMGTIPEVALNESTSDKRSFETLLPTFQSLQLNDTGLDGLASDPIRLGQDLVGSALTGVNNGINKLVGINSMTAALNNYLRKASNGSSGVPLSYYLREVTKGDIAEAWVAKNHPRAASS